MLDHLSVKTLRLLCSGEGVSDTGCKKDLIEKLVRRVVSKTKGKNRVDGSSQSSSSWFKKALERSLEKLIQATLERLWGCAAMRAFMLRAPVLSLHNQPVHSGFAPFGASAYRSSIPNPGEIKLEEGKGSGLNSFRRIGEILEGSLEPASLVISWLENKVSWFPREVKSLILLEGDRATISFRNHYSWAVGPERAMQKPCLEITSCKDSLIEILLSQTKTLAFQAVDKRYRAKLGKTQYVFTKFCNWTGEVACPASINIVRAFLGWLELAGLTIQVQDTGPESKGGSEEYKNN
ncbi:29214_t:CDS:2 [Gigaspora margarita]|uniref:29214_t:CDS:1 n=1 Tax=Gigaspora margarita TaxID=4874 RepID=A0ABN7UVY4_GIGMA|nr:29214_t:CDS:2 [Gigaspora margarita]